MKKSLLFLLAISLEATTIQTLLSAIKNTPDYKLDTIMTKEVKIEKKNIQNSLYPKLNLTASAEHFSIPTAMRSLPPTESAKITATNGSLPFSQNIYRIGFNFSMPLFVKEIYDKKRKMNYIFASTKYTQKINLLKKQASLITLISNLNYSFKLKEALIQQKNSILTTYKSLKVGVDVGRIPEFKLLRLQDSLNQIDIKIANLNQNIAKLQADIFKLTKQNITTPIKLYATKITKGEFISIKPLKEKLKADKYDIKASKDKNIPKVELKISANRAFGKAYNTNDMIGENYASGGVYITWAIFNKQNNSQIEKSKVQYLKTSLNIEKLTKDLTADIKKIDQLLFEINKSIKLTLNSLALKKELLKSAKVAFKMDRMSVDEYLKYEDDLATTKANLASLVATKNSLIAQKALIYGKNLEKVFK